jgi:hypothetical protein
MILHVVFRGVIEVACAQVVSVRNVIKELAYSYHISTGTMRNYCCTMQERSSFGKRFSWVWEYNKPASGAQEASSICFRRGFSRHCYGREQLQWLQLLKRPTCPDHSGRRRCVPSRHLGAWLVRHLAFRFGLRCCELLEGQCQGSCAHFSVVCTLLSLWTVFSVVVFSVVSPFWSLE